MLSVKYVRVASSGQLPRVFRSLCGGERVRSEDALGEEGSEGEGFLEVARSVDGFGCR